jgi:hypothetical protein
MGSIAQDRKGDMALGYSVVNGIDVYPGIRYTGRLAGAPLGQMTLGEGTIINGSGVQTNTNSRWGDYTSMDIDPVDDCTFWYVNEYYQTTQPPPDRNWQTRDDFAGLPEDALPARGQDREDKLRAILSGTVEDEIDRQTSTPAAGNGDLHDDLGVGRPAVFYPGAEDRLVRGQVSRPFRIRPPSIGSRTRYGSLDSGSGLRATTKFTPKA